MQSTMKLLTIITLISITFNSSHQSGAKLRRDGVLNLYPFPRVGRASYRTWQIPINDVYLDYEPVEKRQLYAFPRVGRGGPPSDRNEPHDDLLGLHLDDPGMWFGPRLGRSLKNGDDDVVNQNEDGRSEREPIDQIAHEDRMKRRSKLL
ncbi:CAPA peptides-like [Bombyx mandarina]|uniref:CAPA peptides-like n=1 Tax=Bombyx mandarina TaxID=7092 RepID=A0A6J2JFJ0_BOMMA|nr:CAPA peptides-like [Bombyx mandarina]